MCKWIILNSVHLLIGLGLSEPVVQKIFHCQPSQRADQLQLLYKSSISAGNYYWLNVPAFQKILECQPQHFDIFSNFCTINFISVYVIAIFIFMFWRIGSLASR